MDPLVTAFYNELLRLRSLDYPDVELDIREGPRFINIIEHPLPPANPVHVNTLARIERATLDVYAPTGTKAKGNLRDLYRGFDLIDGRGVIVGLSRERYIKRLKELNEEPQNAEPPQSAAKPQCEGLTKTGQRCKNYAKQGSRFCHIHSRE